MFVQTIARQLAEILLRGMCEQSYWSPLEDPPTVSPLDDPTRQGHPHSKNYSLSRRPRVYSGEKYVPLFVCSQSSTVTAALFPSFLDQLRLSLLPQFVLPSGEHRGGFAAAAHQRVHGDVSEIPLTPSPFVFFFVALCHLCIYIWVCFVSCFFFRPTETPS